MLDTYCTIFELDWRKDRAFKNKKEFLSINPVYVAKRDGTNFQDYGRVDKFEALAMLKKACVPFVGDIAKSMVNYK